MFYEHITTPVTTRLAWLIDSAQAAWHILEIGGGTLAATVQGHVAVAEHWDLTAHLTETGDVFSLPYAEQSFDVIVCQDVMRFLYDGFPLVTACSTLLKPGGWLVINEISAPDDHRAARYIDAFERLGDPRHRRTYAEFEWAGLLLDAGLALENSEPYTQQINLLEWAETLARPTVIIDRLHILLAQAPRAVMAWLQPQYANSPAANFTRHMLQITGRKEA